jgi:iron complex outermembrane receptor protein
MLLAPRAGPRLRSILSLTAFLAAGASAALGQQVPIPLPPISYVEGPSRTPKLLSRASATTTVITGEELQWLGVRFLSDALRIAPGIEVQRSSSTESGVSARGYNDDTAASQGILTLVDGRQAYNDFFGADLWENLFVDLYDVKQIEIIRGPASFVHGPGPMHGLINIVHRSPLDYASEEFFLRGHAGSYGSHVETVTYARRRADAGITVRAVRDDIDEFDPRDENAKDKAWAEVRFETLLGDRDHRLDVAAGTGRQKFNVIIPPFEGLPHAEFANESQDSYARATYVLDRIRVQATWTRFDAEAQPDVIYTPFQVVLDSADADLHCSTDVFPDHLLTFGAGVRYARFETHDADVSGGSHATHLEWLFVQDEIEIDQTWFLTGGIRTDDHSVAGTRLSPRLALVWRFDPGPVKEKDEEEASQYLRLTAGYGFRNPSLRELWFDMPILGGLGRIAGNTNLEAEKLRSLELGYWGRPTDRVQAEVSVYYNLIDRLVGFRQISAGPPVTYAPQNLNKDEAAGVEAALEMQVTGEVRAFANWAFEHRWDRDTHARNPAAPRHKANGGVRVALEGDLTLSAWATFFDDVGFLATSGVPSSRKVDEYALVNARVAKGLTLGEVRGTAFVQAFNLLDHDHLEQPEGDAYGLIVMAGLEVSW